MVSARAVVFDMDGLMFDTERCYWEAATRLLARRGKKYTQELNDAIMGRPPRVCFETMIQWHNLDEDWQTLAAESQEIFLEILHKYLRPMPGLFPLLDSLEKAGIPKAVCTSSTRRITDAILGPFRLHERFAFTLTAEDVVNGKPHPEIYLKAAQLFALPPAQVMVLEDSEAGCQAAHQAGCFVVAIPGPHSAKQNFSMANVVLSGLEDPRLYRLLGLQMPETITGKSADDDASTKQS